GLRGGFAKCELDPLSSQNTNSSRQSRLWCSRPEASRYRDSNLELPGVLRVRLFLRQPIRLRHVPRPAGHFVAAPAGLEGLVEHAGAAEVAAEALRAGPQRAEAGEDHDLLSGPAAAAVALEPALLAAEQRRQRVGRARLGSLPDLLPALHGPLIVGHPRFLRFHERFQGVEQESAQPRKGVGSRYPKHRVVARSPTVPCGLTEGLLSRRGLTETFGRV